jgi:hypothetical protein
LSTFSNKKRVALWRRARFIIELVIDFPWENGGIFELIWYLQGFVLLT